MFTLVRFQTARPSEGEVIAAELENVAPIKVISVPLREISGMPVVSFHACVVVREVFFWFCPVCHSGDVWVFRKSWFSGVASSPGPKRSNLK